MPGPIDEFFSKQIPSEVWHYTTIGGLEGILSSNRIWATDAGFTTDATEFVHARKVAVDYLNSLQSADQHVAFARDAALEMVTRSFDRGVLSRNHTEVYVISFSAAVDLKSQWMEYADGGRGVSIAFDLRAIRPPTELEFGITLAPCVYGAVEKEGLIRAALAHFIDSAATHHKQSRDLRWLEGQLRTFAIIQRIEGHALDKDEFFANLMGKVDCEIRTAALRTSFDLLRLAGHCKDESFSQENEWRVALPRLTSKPLVHVKVEFRGPKNNIPYLASNLFQKNNRLPITRVMTGPLCEDYAKLEAILDSSGYDVPIVRSGIPLRSPDSI
jgi:hypothetical protein